MSPTDPGRFAKGGTMTSYADLMPNLLVAGVTKAGTSSLYWYLIQHPEICPPADRKEIDFFTPLRHGKPIAGTPEDYGRNFARHGGERFRLDASPHYFNGGRRLIEAVHDHIPKANIVIALRDPVERVWSTFRNRKAAGKFDADYSFAEYFDRCLELRAAGLDHLEEYHKFHSVSLGCYVEYLDDWFDVFGEQIRIVFFEHLIREPAMVVEELCDWLNLDAARVATFNFDARNRTVDPRSVRFSNFANAVNLRAEPYLRRAPAVKEAARRTYEVLNGRRDGEVMSPAERRRAAAFYQPYTERLRAELRRRGYADFPPWMAEVEAI